MSVNGQNSVAIGWKPLLSDPNADLSQKLSVVWHVVSEGEPMVESPRYLDLSALRYLVGGHAVSLCFLDVGSDPERGLTLVRTLREFGIPVVALHTENDPDLILSCLHQVRLN